MISETNYFQVNHFTRYGIQEQYISEDAASRLKQQKMSSIMETDIDFNAVSDILLVG